MSKYAYEQFEKALKESGHKFSDSDMALAKYNPDVGMSLLQYGKDYTSATTAEAKALAHQGAEALRKKYGGYRGGDDGSKFYIDQNAAPIYQDSYADQKKKLMDAILNRKDFSYDASKDPVAQSYEKQYAREGKRATDNVMASAAAATGGMPSSFAVSAASQAGNQYAAKMADKIPELEQMAYGRYLQDLNLKHSDLQMVDNASKTEYNQYLNALNQYNTDRNFEHVQSQDKLAQQNADRNFEHMLNQDKLAQQNTDRNFEHMVNQDKLAQQNTDRNFEHMQSQDKLDREYQQRQEQLKLALIKAENGDYSGLKALGVDTSKMESRASTSSGGGYYRSGGGGSSGGSYTDDDASGDFASGGLSGDVVNKLLDDYPDGKVPNSQWKKLVSLYGENVLRNAGFSAGGPKKPNVIHKQNGAMNYTLEKW